MNERLTKTALWLGLAVAGAMITHSHDASGLLIDKTPFQEGEFQEESAVEFTYHYPYPTSLTYVDPGYAFDDDPLMAFPHIPYSMPVLIKRMAVRRAMVMPRSSFVQEMCDSADVL